MTLEHDIWASYLILRPQTTLNTERHEEAIRILDNELWNNGLSKSNLNLPPVRNSHHSKHSKTMDGSVDHYAIHGMTLDTHIFCQNTIVWKLANYLVVACNKTQLENSSPKIALITRHSTQHTMWITDNIFHEKVSGTPLTLSQMWK